MIANFKSVTFALIIASLMGADLAMAQTLTTTPSAAPDTRPDTREAIAMAPADREFVLGQMRGFLEAMQGVMENAAAGNPAQVAAIARATGMAHTGDTPASVRQSLPMAFRQLGRDTHMRFDAIADTAEKGGDAAAIFSAVTAMLANCNSCHQAYKLVTK